ncbi:MAG: T9SS C-terminal target domain-containing protein, partial [Cytophagales bacterium]
VTAQNLSTIVYTVTVTELSSLTGISGVLKNENNVFIYPNPAENEVTIEGINSNEVISIYNGIGTLIFKTVSTDSKIIVNTQFFASGIYFVKFDFSKKVLKLLIKK